MKQTSESGPKSANLWAVVGMTLCFVVASISLLSGLAQKPAMQNNGINTAAATSFQR